MILQTRIGKLIKDLKAISEVDIWLLSAGDQSVLEFVHQLQIDQLQRGQRPDGTEYPIYSEVSQAVYGKPNAPFKWEDSGYFYKHIKPIVGPDFIQINDNGTIGDDGERINLEVRFNEEIIGLQNDSLKELTEKIKEKYLFNLREVILR